MRDSSPPVSGKRLWPWLVGVGLALVALVLHRHVSFDALMAKRAAIRLWTQAHPVIALPVFMLVYAIAVALALPGAALLTIGGGFLFGWLIGGMASVIGATIGALLLFLLARTAIGDWLRRRAGGALDKVIAGFQADAVSYLLFLRLAPVFPFFVVNLAAAAFNAPLRTFAWTTFVGIIPATFAYALAGAGLESALAAEAAALDRCVQAQHADCTLKLSPASLLTAPTIAAMVALALIALIPVAVKRWRAASASAGRNQQDKPQG